MLTQNTVNSIDALYRGCTSPVPWMTVIWNVCFSDEISPESKLLLNTMVLGLESIMESCRTEKKKNQFLNISTEEV